MAERCRLLSDSDPENAAIFSAGRQGFRPESREGFRLAKKNGSSASSAAVEKRLPGDIDLVSYLDPGKISGRSTLADSMVTAGRPSFVYRMNMIDTAVSCAGNFTSVSGASGVLDPTALPPRTCLSLRVLYAIESAT